MYLFEGEGRSFYRLVLCDYAPDNRVINPKLLDNNREPVRDDLTAVKRPALAHEFDHIVLTAISAANLLWQ